MSKIVRVKGGEGVYRLSTTLTAEKLATVSAVAPKSFTVIETDSKTHQETDRFELKLGPVAGLGKYTVTLPNSADFDGTVLVTLTGTSEVQDATIIRATSFLNQLETAVNKAYTTFTAARASIEEV
jgi:hypothetical protein